MKQLVIINHDHQLVAVLGKKCASSSIRSLFLGLSKKSPGDVYINDYWSQNIDDNNLSARWIPTQKLVDFQKARPEYRWFTVVRNPHLRALSIYFNKINLLTKQFHRSIYFYGKLRKLTAGYSAWRNNQVSLAAMREKISFEEFLLSLRKHGLMFDNHFTPQSIQIGCDYLKFDRILRVETLNEDLPNFLTSIGITITDVMIPRANESRYQNPRLSFFTPETISLVQSLYEADFSKLGYDPNSILGTDITKIAA